MRENQENIIWLIAKEKNDWFEIIIIPFRNLYKWCMYDYVCRPTRKYQVRNPKITLQFYELRKEWSQDPRTILCVIPKIGA